MFELLTPVSYWILAVLWLVILGLYVGQLRHLKASGGAIAVLLTILALDAFRTLFETTYFGLYFNSQFGLLPESIGVTLGRPELLIIPKLINIAAGVTVLFLLIRRWLPHEIRSREEALEELRSNEELYRDFVEGSNDLVTRSDPQGNLTFVNFKAGEIWGRAPEDCLGRSALEFIHLDDRQKLLDAYYEWLRDKPKHVTHENRQINQTTGALRHLLWTVSPHFDEEGNLTHFNNVGRDISERIRAEEQQRLLATAVDQATESIVITDPSGSIEYVNPAFETRTGYTREDALGENPRILQSGVHDQAFYADLWGTLTQGRVWQGRFVNMTKAGAIFEEEATISPVHDTRGKLVNFVAVNRDVTREAELESRLLQAQKMEAIGTLAGGVAHDFNNILQIMLGYLDLARLHTSADSRVSTSLAKIGTAGERATELVDQLLAFSRQSKHERKPLRIQLILKEILTLLRSSIPSTIEIRASIDPDAGPVLADATEMHQVAMNLCTNAYHAMRETGGVLEVRLDQVALDAEAASFIPGLHAGSHVCLSIRDTGAGMQASTLERIFDPYYTTKKVGEGTGLGLATVRGIVEGCGGAVTVESEPGIGSRFHVYFPPCTEVVEDEAATQDTGRLPRGSERVLLVDDEPMVAEQARLGLSELGYKVESFTRSHDALEAFRTAAVPFDLVITDQTMPGLTGIELSRELLRLEPDLPIILCTGYSELVDESIASEAGVRRYLRKPLLPRKLAAEIRLLLDGTPVER